MLNVSDDILVYGKSPEEHDNNLKQVLSQLREKGLTLKKKKCAFSQDNLKYLGYIFSKEGLSPDPDKVSALKDTSAPSNPTEVRSLLGMANYCLRFIPNYATITEPMRELMKRDTEWHWEKPQEEAFNLLKRSLREDTVTQYYDPKKTTEIIVDASPVGLGAIVVQDTKEERVVISYTSRALTPVEQRYLQTEGEALAVVFGCERYHLYVMGSRFTVVTDHKPLVSIYNNPQSNPPAWIERGTLRLQRYDMTVVYRPGKKIPPPAPHLKAYRAEMEGEEYVNFVAIKAVPKAITFEEAQEETLKDEVLQQDASAIERNKLDHLLDKKSPNNNAFKSFYKVQSELTIANGRSYVLRGTSHLHSRLEKST